MTNDELRREVEALRNWLKDHEYDETISDELWNEKRHMYFKLRRAWKRGKQQ